MKNNIVLVGFMGSGKTSVGKRLAEEIGYKFIDTDEDIEQINGMTINQIFKKHGEYRFRSEETLALKRLKEYSSHVIATGGGIVVREENRRLLKELGTVVYLKADIEIIVDRVSRRNTRPLLNVDNIRDQVEKLSTERKSLYEEVADFVVDTSNGSFEKSIKKIKEYLNL